MTHDEQPRNAVEALKTIAHMTNGHFSVLHKADGEAVAVLGIAIADHIESGAPLFSRRVKVSGFVPGVDDSTADTVKASPARRAPRTEEDTKREDLIAFEHEMRMVLFKLSNVRIECPTSEGITKARESLGRARLAVESFYQSEPRKASLDVHDARGVAAIEALQGLTGKFATLDYKNDSHSIEALSAIIYAKQDAIRRDWDSALASARDYRQNMGDAEAEHARRLAVLHETVAQAIDALTECAGYDVDAPSDLEKIAALRDVAKQRMEHRVAKAVKDALEEARENGDVPTRTVEDAAQGGDPGAFVSGMRRAAVLVGETMREKHMKTRWQSTDLRDIARILVTEIDKEALGFAEKGAGSDA